MATLSSEANSSVASPLGHDHYNLFYFLHCINMSLSEIILSCVYWCIYFLCCLECKLLDCRILIMLHTGVPLYLTQNRNNKHSRNEWMSLERNTQSLLPKRASILKNGWNVQYWAGWDQRWRWLKESQSPYRIQKTW